ncbi:MULTISPECIES: hypothetical protein [unclassified Salinibacterium]|uniref:hypothetical protein n=1 Tax=unclassified Salinibacterium TaxID=2632331 RepID=UPI0018CC91C7|nr:MULTISPECIES: hypothetical protein [unclassified Salinibacterium]MBH0052873.1 hypothetical protein [Salinibacterium sp. SWN139]MBH0082141.1 hypothetical protein [Salinibacterium sp. SWN167]
MTMSKHPGTELEPEAVAATPSWLGTRPRRVIAAGIVIALLVVLGVVLFGQFAPTATPGAAPAATPSAGASTESPAATATATAAPVDGPAVPDVTPVPIEEPADVTAGLVAKVTKVEEVDGTARGPGEVAGPSLRVTVTMTNSTASVVSLRTTVISCYFGADRTPAPELREPGGAPLPASLAANSAIDGVYIFTVPADQRGNVTLLVDYSVDVQPVVFQGDIADLL